MKEYYFKGIVEMKGRFHTKDNALMYFKQYNTHLIEIIEEREDELKDGT